MTVFGFTGQGAEIIEKEKRGEKWLLRVTARGVSKRAAKRAAVIEATALVPVRHQDVINITKTRSFGRLNKRYLVTIAENREKEMDVVGSGY